MAPNPVEHPAESLVTLLELVDTSLGKLLLRRWHGRRCCRLGLRCRGRNKSRCYHGHALFDRSGKGFSNGDDRPGAGAEHLRWVELADHHRLAVRTAILHAPIILRLGNESMATMATFDGESHIAAKVRKNSNIRKDNTAKKTYSDGLQLQ